MAESDFYSPEYWPANRLIGELENVLVKAKSIIGLLTSSQIESLEAGKIAGLIESIQIKELAAGKISGLLTDSQIKELAAAKVAGQLTNSQIESMEAKKVIGQLVAGQIAAGAITTEKLAAGSVVASKIAVETLSAISANLGTITAGILKAVKIEGGTGSFEGELTALKLKLGVTNEKLEAKSMIQWVGKEIEGKVGIEENFLGLAFTWRAEVVPTSATFHGPMRLSMKYRFGSAGEEEQNGLIFKFREVEEKLIFGEWHPKGKSTIFEASIFPQLAPPISPSNVKINFGVVSFPFTGTEFSTAQKIKHGLGKTPIAVVVTPRDSSISPSVGEEGAETFTVNGRYRNAVTGTGTGMWIAIG